MTKFQRKFQRNYDAMKKFLQKHSERAIFCDNCDLVLYFCEGPTCLGCDKPICFDCLKEKGIELVNIPNDNFNFTGNPHFICFSCIDKGIDIDYD